MKLKKLSLLIVVLLNIYCKNKCKEAEDLAKTKNKDPQLMYIWRYTDNLIITKGVTEVDSGFYSFKPNGDYNTAAKLERINMIPRIWYSNNNTISTSFCSDGTPGENSPLYKYQIKNDTLFLYSYFQNKVFSTTPKTFIHVKKY